MHHEIELSTLWSSKSEIRVKTDSMKNWFKMLVVALGATAMVGCNEPDLNPAEKMDVTPHNISGEWELVSYGNGVNLAEGSYVYLDIRRQDREFTEYQNIDNALGTVTTGRYYIYEDAKYGAVIRGEYDNSEGAWNHRYKVTLYKSEMVWTALDDATEVCVYQRCEIPEQIKVEDEE